MPKSHSKALHAKKLPSPTKRTSNGQQAEILNNYQLVIQLLTLPSRTEAIRVLDQARRKYVEQHPIAAKLYGREAPNRRGRPAVISAQSLGIFVALDCGVLSKAQIKEAFGRDYMVGGNNSAHERWINRRFKTGQETFLTMPQQRQIEIRKRFYAMPTDRLRKFLTTLPSK